MSQTADNHNVMIISQKKEKNKKMNVSKVKIHARRVHYVIIA